ncbi:hypothetical protein CsSME_00028745 [Camellia sinensis var. sinensis]
MEEDEEGSDSEMDDCDGSHSIDPDWINDGLDGSEYGNIFAYYDKDVGVESNVGVEATLGVESNIRDESNGVGSNEWYSDQDYDKHTLYGSLEDQERVPKFLEFCNI